MKVSEWKTVWVPLFEKMGWKVTSEEYRSAEGPKEWSWRVTSDGVHGFTTIQRRGNMTKPGMM